MSYKVENRQDANKRIAELETQLAEARESITAEQARRIAEHIQCAVGDGSLDRIIAYGMLEDAIQQAAAGKGEG